MERLTKRYEDGTYAAADNLPCGENSYQYKGLLLEALGKYEDTGLEPDECAEYKKFEDELISKGFSFSHIVELMELELHLSDIFNGQLSLKQVVDELETTLTEPDKPHPVNAKILTYEDAYKWKEYQKAEEEQ